MTSQYTGEFIYGAGGNNGNQNRFPYNFRQQQEQQPQQQRTDLLIGKRSFNDYYSSKQQQQQNIFLPQQLQLQYQQQQRFSNLQKVEQQQRQLQNQYLIRSVKQHSNNASLSNNNDNNNNIHINNANNYLNNCSTGYVVPDQPKPVTFQKTNPMNNSFNTNYNTNPIINPGETPGFITMDPIVDDEKLKELEKILFSDDVDAVPKEGVSDVTYSEWTIENLVNPVQGLSPDPVEPISKVVAVIPSPSSTGSSCCSPGPINVVEAVSIKQLITETATAISEGHKDVVKECLAKLAEFGDRKGNPEERLVYYIGNALKSRVWPMEYTPPVNELYTADQMSAVYNLFNISPCFKYGLMAANLVLLEAITAAIKQGVKIIHVVDFDISHGAQYVNLLRVLAEQKTPSFVKIKLTIVKTEFGNLDDVLASSRDELVSLAERLGLNLEYFSTSRPILELTRESIGCEEEEAVLVNFAFKLYRIPDESVSIDNLRDELLRRVTDLSPRAVTLIEQDLNGNTAPFTTRVAEAWGYYGALFDSLEASLPRDNLDRARIEEAMGRKIGNLIACEGKDRVERAEVFGKWRARMGMAGFELKAINKKVVETMRAKLDLAKDGNSGFTVKEENGGVGFGWAGRSITTASAWR